MKLLFTALVFMGVYAGAATSQEEYFRYYSTKTNAKLEMLRGATFGYFLVACPVTAINNLNACKDMWRRMNTMDEVLISRGLVERPSTYPIR